MIGVISLFLELWEGEKLPVDSTLCDLADKIRTIYQRINIVLSEMHSMEQHTLFYHYTDIKGLQSMLGEKGANVLRLYNPMHFNDPEEGNIFIKSKTDVDYFYDENNDEENFPHIILHKGMNFSFHVCSFSEMNDRLDLWRAYGKGGDGYSVSVKIPPRLRPQEGGRSMVPGRIHGPVKSGSVHLNDDDSSSQKSSQDMKKTEPIFIRKVLYGESSVKDSLKFHGKNNVLGLGTLEDALSDLISALNSLNKPPVESVVKKMVRHLLGELRYLYKNIEYENECEHRIVDIMKLSDCELKFDEGNFPPRLYIETPPFLFEEEGNKIFAGPNLSDKDYDLVKLYLEKTLADKGWGNTTCIDRSKFRTQ